MLVQCLEDCTHTAMDHSETDYREGNQYDVSDELGEQLLQFYNLEAERGYFIQVESESATQEGI